MHWSFELCRPQFLQEEKERQSFNPQVLTLVAGRPTILRERKMDFRDATDNLENQVAYLKHRGTFNWQGSHEEVNLG